MSATDQLATEADTCRELVTPKLNDVLIPATLERVFSRTH